MKFGKMFMGVVAFVILMISCGDDDDSSGGAAASGDAGLVIQDIDSAMGSLAISPNTALLGGVATSYCNENGGAASAGTDIARSSTTFSGATGYCQATHNAQSPDTPRGAMYIAGIMGCIASNNGLFANLTPGGEPATTTTSVTIDTTCFGTQAMVDAMIADMGTDTLTGITLTASQLAETDAYDYSMSFDLGEGESASIYIKNSDNIKAALFTDSTGPWFVKLDQSESNTVVLYEGIDTTNLRRMRIHVAGELDANGEFSSLDGVNGFWLQGGNNQWSDLVTFTGDLTLGFLGMGYANGGGSDLTNGGAGNCYLPGGTGTCTDLTPITSSTANGDTLFNGMTTAAAALRAYTSSIISFTSIDPTDADITQ